ncbi:MAG: hypothetical protein E7195_01635 [Peptococcaceae bacterium]|nr:hypothetical protein [Peptococcaceae bacterium]
MKAKKIYLSDEMIQNIQTKISGTNQSFSDYVRGILLSNNIPQPAVPDENFIEHTRMISTLSNVIHQYTLKLAEKDLYEDCLPDLIHLQKQMETLIELESELLKNIFMKEDV